MFWEIWRRLLTRDQLEAMTLSSSLLRMRLSQMRTVMRRTR